MKKIHCESDLEDWQKSPAFNSLQIFFEKLFSSIRGLKLSEIPKREEGKLWRVLERIEEAVEAIEPEEMSGQRYGNKSFRKLIGRVEEIADKELENEFMRRLLLGSFGDSTRIDYGTGHELAFIILVMCHYNNIENTENTEETEKMKIDYSEIGGWLIGSKYLNLVRKIQMRYSLEPAGSHGVWGLDDHQFIPFLLGSAQLIGKENCNALAPDELIKVENFCREELRSEYLYAAALDHIHRLKTRGNASLQFYHHSPLLYDISGVASWQRIHDGLRRMYVKEVLMKVPVVQHLIFDDELFKYNKH